MQLVQVRDLDFAINIVGGDILREDDGLASSSRNKRLATEARQKAPCIYKGLCNALQAWRAGERDSGVLRNEVLKLVEASGAQIDYIEVVHAHTLASLDNVEGQEAVIAVAAFFPAADGTTVRLIDNIQLMGT
jgi:pantoate--beta-alanine ligase